MTSSQSNGPFELLPVLGDFLAIAHLPPGSMKLRSYAGRSLFSGLLSAPATRKRANVQDVLDAFPHSRFILIGDTGEQDMELYAEQVFSMFRYQNLTVIPGLPINALNRFLQSLCAWPTTLHWTTPPADPHRKKFNSILRQPRMRHTTLAKGATPRPVTPHALPPPTHTAAPKVNTLDIL